MTDRGSGGPAVLAAGFTHAPAGRFVRVTRAPDPLQPVGDADRNTLSLDEVQVFAAPYDDDGDGIADRWEREHFGNLLAADATSHADADGASDREEFIAGTDPLDAASVLRLSFGPGPFPSLRWPGASGRVYGLDRSLDGAAAWEVRAAGLPSSVPWTAYTDVVSAATAPVYRVRAEFSP